MEFISKLENVGLSQVNLKYVITCLGVHSSNEGCLALRSLISSRLCIPWEYKYISYCKSY